MEMVREREAVQVRNAELEAQQHNAQISERYRKLQDAMNDQFSSALYVEPTRASTATIERTYTEPVQETPVVEQAPEVTDYVREQYTSSVFTADKFNALENGNGATISATTVAPVYVAPTYVAPITQQATATAMEVGAQEKYSLTPFAKAAMAVFGAVVIGMVSLIGVNSSMISQKKIKIKNLEKQREQLLQQHEEIQQQIEIAKSEQSILEWAQSQGLMEAAK